MYAWRKLNDAQRTEALQYRVQLQRPWHSIPHLEFNGDRNYLLTASCYEHVAHIGNSMERITDFEDTLLTLLNTYATDVYAWVILPNHYHALVSTAAIKPLLRETGRLHGRTSHAWNGEQNLRGRKVWCNCAETVMKSERHFLATLNYIHHNPVKHGYVSRWQDWPYTSAHDHLNQFGRKHMQSLWRDYPIDDYGAGWDD
jgi:putative transposase